VLKTKKKQYSKVTYDSILQLQTARKKLKYTHFIKNKKVIKTEVEKCMPDMWHFFRLLMSGDFDLWPFQLKTGNPLTRALENIYINFDFSYISV